MPGRENIKVYRAQSPHSKSLELSKGQGRHRVTTTEDSVWRDDYGRLTQRSKGGRRKYIASDASYPGRCMQEVTFKFGLG